MDRKNRISKNRWLHFRNAWWETRRSATWSHMTNRLATEKEEKPSVWDQRGMTRTKDEGRLLKSPLIAFFRSFLSSSFLLPPLPTIYLLLASKLQKVSYPESWDRDSLLRNVGWLLSQRASWREKEQRAESYHSICCPLSSEHNPLLEWYLQATMM